VLLIGRNISGRYLPATPKKIEDHGAPRLRVGRVSVATTLAGRSEIVVRNMRRPCLRRGPHVFSDVLDGISWNIAQRNGSTQVEGGIGQTGNGIDDEV
jgi:hypothetical protein